VLVKWQRNAGTTKYRGRGSLAHTALVKAATVEKHYEGKDAASEDTVKK